MIAIFSQRDFEISTEEVIDWLRFKKADYFRLNGSDHAEEMEYSEAGNFASISSILDQVNICWYRRWMDHNFLESIAENNSLNIENNIRIYKHLRGELLTLNTRFWNMLRDKKWLSSPFEITLNKLQVLDFARALGLNCPPTIITTRKNTLIDFQNKYERIISKAIGEVVYLKSENKRLTLKTAEVATDDIKVMPDSFFPTMFQKLIEKKYEIRSFYLNNKFYSMAIFSQNDPQTAIDFRNYNISKPNRKVPYCLPKTLESKLMKLVKKLKLTTCSIDLIKSVENNYYFLEINPVGQFGMTSKPCNYYLEAKIADYLISKDSGYEN